MFITCAFRYRRHYTQQVRLTECGTYLTTERQKVESLTAKIHTLESEINSNVYQLFNLTPEEIKLIEEIFKK